MCVRASQLGLLLVIAIFSATGDSTVVPELGGPIFGSSVNPIQTGGGQIIPTNNYWHPQIFSPTGITAQNPFSSLSCLQSFLKVFA